MNINADLLFTERKPELSYIKNYYYNFADELVKQKDIGNLARFVQLHPDYKLN